MRLALLSDIHGNTIALDAVLADVAAQGGVDAYWALGDFAVAGPDPAGVLTRLVALPGLRPVRGNTDRYVATGDRSPRSPTVEEARADPARLALLVDIVRSFAWTQGALAATGWLDWLAALPLEQRLVLPDGTRLLGVHAAPGCDDGSGIPPALGDDALRALLAGCAADLVCVGHTHRPLDRVVDGIRVVNLGSVGNPLGADPRASYALLEADATGYRLCQRRVEYDRGAVVQAIRRVRHPAAAFLAGFYAR